MSSRAEWRSWLGENHATSKGVWLVTFKKTQGELHLPYGHAVEEALCFGWIDSLEKGFDSLRGMQWYAPRRPGSLWSASNKARVRALLAAKLITEAGLVKIEAAKADGTWNLLDSVEALEIPADLVQAFNEHLGSREGFQAFPASVRKASLRWIVLAKTETTRAKRVTEVARLSAQGTRPPV